MAKKSKKDDANAEPLSFEEATARLEGIVHELEEGQIPLADSLERYEEGVGLLKQCYDLLTRAEHRIERLSGVDEQGEASTEPFDNEETSSLEEKAKSRSRRRSQPRTGKTGPARDDADMDGSKGLF